MKMNLYIKIMFLFMITIFGTGCGERVQVGTGEVGKIVGPSGLENGIRRTSSFRLDACWTGACPYLVKMQSTKATQKVTVEQVFLIKSRVDLKNVETGIQFRVRQDDKSINTIFSEVRPHDRIITQEAIWQIYLERKSPAAIVAVLRDYTIEDILQKIPEIEAACKAKLAEDIKDLPVEITDLGFPNGIGDIPEKVIESYRNLYAVEADKQRQIKQLEADLEVEKQSMTVQKVRAKNDRAIAGELGVPVGEYMNLKIGEKFADAVGDAAQHDQPFAIGSFPIK